MNPCDFKSGDKVFSFYTGEKYKVLESNKSGMEKLINLENNAIEDWNACNNNHFNKLEGQLKLF